MNKLLKFKTINFSRIDFESTEYLVLDNIFSFSDVSLICFPPIDSGTNHLKYHLSEEHSTVKNFITEFDNSKNEGYWFHSLFPEIHRGNYSYGFTVISNESVEKNFYFLTKEKATNALNELLLCFSLTKG